MNPSILAPDDFQIGFYILVIKGKFFNEDGEWAEDHSFKENILQITAIDLPFIVVTFPRSSASSYKIFDIREGWQFKKLSNEFVKAVLQKK